jgi:hypothetical protein
MAGHIYAKTHYLPQRSSEALWTALAKTNPWTGPEGSRRLRLPDFKTIGT